MKFHEDYFKAEDRNGFYIRPMVKRAWAANIEILLEIERVCTKHNIRWFVNCGTLLGAVREKGFIAWDDDIDLSMPRPDYERFVKCAPNDLSGSFIIKNYRGDPTQAQPFICVANSDKGINLDEDFLTRFHGCPYIMGIDVFPMDDMPETPEEDELYRTLIGGAMDVAQNAPDGILLNDCHPDIITEATELCNICGVDIKESEPIGPQMYTLADQISSMYAGSKSEYYTVGAFHHCRPWFMFSKEAYSDTVLLPFEEILVPVMKGYDEVLKSWYGPNYMTPRQGAGMHDYPSFKKYEIALKEAFAKNDMACPELFID